MVGAPDLKKGRMPREILVADDEKAMLSLYSRLFSDKGYRLTLASSFAEAAELIAKNSYDLLVTDLTFPDGLGTELVRMFDEKKAGARSLLVTGSNPEDRELDLPSSSRYFEKPFKVDAFLAAVEQALSA